MITEHIQRYQSMTDIEFLKHAGYYKRFKNVTKYEHTYNVDYITQRCLSLGYNFVQGCCGQYSLEKINDTKEQQINN